MSLLSSWLFKEKPVKCVSHPLEFVKREAIASYEVATYRCQRCGEISEWLLERSTNFDHHYLLKDYPEIQAQIEAAKAEDEEAKDRVALEKMRDASIHKFLLMFGKDATQKAAFREIKKLEKKAFSSKSITDEEVKRLAARLGRK